MNSIDYLETIKRYYRVDRSRIAYIRFTLEAYDGLANVTTLDPDLGIIRLTIAPGCELEGDAIINDLKREILIEPVEPEKTNTGQR